MSVPVVSIDLSKMLTRGQIAQMINETLDDLFDYIRMDNDYHSFDSVHIKGNPKLILEFGKSICNTYNKKNKCWQCEFKHVKDDEYQVEMFLNDGNDEFGWAEVTDEDDVLE